MNIFATVSLSNCKIVLKFAIRSSAVGIKGLFIYVIMEMLSIRLIVTLSRKSGPDKLNHIGPKAPYFDLLISPLFLAPAGHFQPLRNLI